ncbi:MAG: hypothetical protein EOO77_12880 [Oxalobacteraceae bacterium]|nr:MAG: hypothetical protein EOO77_12880 [Oxalobacteraceae bacterium]
MTTPKIALPDIHFGPVDAPPVDWRAHDEPDPDDEELPETPASVVMMLGFDPAAPRDGDGDDDDDAPAATTNKK